jgi:hypothetical protein
MLRRFLGREIAVSAVSAVSAATKARRGADADGDFQTLRLRETRTVNKRRT